MPTTERLPAFKNLNSASVPVSIAKRAAAERIPFWGFYFDDLGAEVGEHLGAVRAGDFGRPLDNTHPSQRVHRRAAFPRVGWCKCVTRTDEYTHAMSVLTLVPIEQGALRPQGCALAGNDASDGKASMSSATR